MLQIPQFLANLWAGLRLSYMGEGRSMSQRTRGADVVKTPARVFKREPARWLFQSFRQLPSPHKTEFTKP